MDGKLVHVSQADVLGTIQVQRRSWAILYGYWRLSDEMNLSGEIGTKAHAAGAHAVVNARVTTDTCWLNNVPFLALLPVWPNCMDVRFSGEAIRLPKLE